MNIGWQEFLGFYTGLNVQRKEYDQKFLEQKGIGEEIEDPANSGDEDEADNQFIASVPQPRLSVAYRDLNNENTGGKVASQVPQNKPIASLNGISGINDGDQSEQQQQ